MRLIRSAFYAGYPILRAMQIRQIDCGPKGTPSGHLVHGRTLKDHLYRENTAPNNDTLYSFAWLDLRNGPVRLQTPSLKDRYHSVALVDLFNDNIAVLGTRTTKGEGGHFKIVGPASHSEEQAGTTVIESPTNDVWMIVRVLVRGRDDLDQARRAQDGFLIFPSAHVERELSDETDMAGTMDPERFLDIVNRGLGRSPLPEKHKRRFARLFEAGLRPGQTGVWPTLSINVQDQWRTDFRGLLTSLRTGRHGLIVRNGWAYPRAGIGDFGQDDHYRAQVALFGLGALPREEAIYLVSVHDADGQFLNGQNTYNMRIPADVPISGFWSLSVYEVSSDGRLFFVKNPLNRYAIGDRAEGIERNQDGSIDITITQYSDVAATDAPNLLPAPRGSFRLIFRAYLPGRALLDGQFALPPVRREVPPV